MRPQRGRDALHGEALLLVFLWAYEAYDLWASPWLTAWLAQAPDGTPLPPPWRELWTFGRDHSWACRIHRSDQPDDWAVNPPRIPGIRGGRRVRTADFPA